MDPLPIFFEKDFELRCMFLSSQMFHVPKRVIEDYQRRRILIELFEQILEAGAVVRVAGEIDQLLNYPCGVFGWQVVDSEMKGDLLERDGPFERDRNPVGIIE